MRTKEQMREYMRNYRAKGKAGALPTAELREPPHPAFQGCENCEKLKEKDARIEELTLRNKKLNDWLDKLQPQVELKKEVPLENKNEGSAGLVAVKAIDKPCAEPVRSLSKEEKLKVAKKSMEGRPLVYFCNKHGVMSNMCKCN